METPERRNDAGSSRTPLRHARRTRAIWQYWRVPALSGLLPPSPALPGSGCPQLRRPAATRSAAEGLSPPLESTAPHGAHMSLTRHAARQSGTLRVVRAENRVRGFDQQSCSPSRPAVMITDHVPAVRLPPDHAGGLMAAAVPA